MLVGREVKRPYSFKFSACERCGLDVDIRRDNATGETETLTAGTDRRHWHEPAVQVALDADELASAIVRASRAARAERQRANTVQTPANTVFAANDTEVKGSINGVDVVAPEP